MRYQAERGKGMRKAAVLLACICVISCTTTAPQRSSFHVPTEKEARQQDYNTRMKQANEVGHMTSENALAIFGLGRKCDSEGDTQICRWDFLDCPPAAAFAEARTGIK